MINFKMDDGIFNFRVAGLLFYENKVLIHRLVQDNFYAFPGGRAEMFENTETTIIREMNEELGIAVTVNRLLWICEDFFTHNQNKYHELCFYYLIECEDESLIQRGDVFSVIEGENEFEFRWIDIGKIQTEVIYPEFIKDRISNLPSSIERVVENYECIADNAIAWAKVHLGSEDYQLKCLGFIEDSLERSNNIEIFGGDSAKESAILYAAHKNTGLPPKGAFVFYDCAGVVDDNLVDWGHCGLSLGNGEVVHAWNVVRIDNYLDMEKLPVAPSWSNPQYIGWAPLERILAGYQNKNY